jgi:hypothetical protein
VEAVPLGTFLREGAPLEASVVAPLEVVVQEEAGNLLVLIGN